ncbi:hypothetical protein AL509_29880 [Achromobacter xylosoxidans]|uniref:DUF4238 domain-containing protein n=1 Tax=Alcaligenes xylosoxydans xylosoxydans TaxID=85698 RepID=UPI000CDC5226|nr:DUF4238 domain-containing protein [Achromobacter xylosoxidans]AUZ20217.1 hypothetical protein AL509_29880 [Achromobacter xylosoxidans]
MSFEVKKQHYVWEYYLKGWAPNGQIWCKREDKIIRSSTENVAQQRYFYEIDPLLDAEIELLSMMIMKGPAINQFTGLSSLATYLSIANSGNKLARFGLEQYHGMIENNALPVLAALREKNFDVLNDRQSKIHLCIYLGHQYTRTKKARNSNANHQALNVPDKYKDCDLKKILSAMGFILANNIGGSLCDRLDLKLVENHSDTKLITSDQPIYNLLAIPGDVSKESSIYFPISPHLALWAKKGPNNEKIDTKEKAQYLNSFMVKNSLEFIFASSEEELEALGT